MDNQIYKAIIIMGIIGIFLILVLIYLNKAILVFKGIWEWIIYDVGGIDRFQGPSMWNWLLIISAIAFCIISCIFESAKKE